MSTDLIRDRGRGPEVVGTRITVYNLLPYLLDASTTEKEVAEIYGLSVEQVASARAYVLNHADAVLSRHSEIEARLADGNPPQLVKQLEETHARLLEFRQWRAQQIGATRTSGRRAVQPPTLEQWRAENAMHTSE